MMDSPIYLYFLQKIVAIHTHKYIHDCYASHHEEQEIKKNLKNGVYYSVYFHCSVF